MKKTPDLSLIAIQWDLYGGSYDDDNCAKRNHGSQGGNVTFLDGYCQWLKQSLWSTNNRPCNQEVDKICDPLRLITVNLS